MWHWTKISKDLGIQILVDFGIFIQTRKKSDFPGV